MSRHELAGTTPGVQIVVGWDNPLQTFFAQVLRPGDEDDDPLLWLGTSWKECLVPEDLVDPLAPFARLDAELIDKLRLDRAASAGDEPTPLQLRLQTLPNLPHCD